MKIAILGAGLSGLAVAWNLLHLEPLIPSLEVVVFDEHGVGGGASGVAAGLLHCFGGARSKLNWRGLEGLKETGILLEKSAAALGKPVLVNQKGILRPAVNTEQKADFMLCAARYSDQVSWLARDAAEAVFAEMAPGAVASEALWIRDGLVVDLPNYLEGLWRGCAARGARLIRTHMHSLEDLLDFDVRVVAVGGGLSHFSELGSAYQSRVRGVKGQIVELTWPSDSPPLQAALNSAAYLVMQAHGASCFLGATYERDYANCLPDPEVALCYLLPKGNALFPGLKESTLIDCRAGIRAVTSNHLPFIEKTPYPATWVIGGMGSKGLLYHALLAKELVQKMLY